MSLTRGVTLTPLERSVVTLKRGVTLTPLKGQSCRDLPDPEYFLGLSESWVLSHRNEEKSYYRYFSFFNLSKHENVLKNGFRYRYG